MESRKAVWIIAVIGFLVFIYVSIRAYILSFTWDESYTFLEFVRRDFYSPSGYGDMSANNHLLNTWLMKFMSAVAGNSEFSLRFPNVLAYLLYAVYSAKISLRFSKPLFAVSAFALLNLNPFMLDFFSLARGYGLSIGLMMPSLFFLYRFLEKDFKTKHVVLSFFFCALGALANLSFINFLIALMSVIYFSLFLRAWKKEISTGSFLKQGMIFLLIPLALLWYLIPISFALREANALYYGGTEGFLGDTVISTVKACLYETKNNFLAEALGILAAATMIVASVWMFADIFRRREINFFFAAVVFLIFACSLLTILQHFFLGTPFLMERTALFFIPLFFLALLFLLERLGKIHTRYSLLAPFFSLLLLAHFLMNANFYFVQQWRENADVKKVIEFLQKNKINPAAERENTYVGGEFICEPCINYYRTIKHLDWLNFVVRPARMLPAQDYYLLPDSREHVLEKNKVKLLARFPAGTALYRNLKKPLSIQMLFHGSMDFETPDSQGREYAHLTDKTGYNSAHCSKTDTTDKFNIYSDGFDYIFPDSLSGLTVLAAFKAMVNVSDKYFNAIIVFQLDSAEKVVFWQAADVMDNIQKPEPWRPVFFTAQLPYEIKHGEHLKVYLWNIGTGEAFIDDLELKIIGYKF